MPEAGVTLSYAIAALTKFASIAWLKRLQDFVSYSSPLYFTTKISRRVEGESMNVDDGHIYYLGSQGHS